MAKATDIPTAVRKAVLERDGHRCRWCGRTNTVLHLHHIIYRSAARNMHTLENLIALCGRHHELVHTDKGKYPALLQALLERPGTTGMQLERWITRTNLPLSHG